MKTGKRLQKWAAALAASFLLLSTGAAYAAAAQNAPAAKPAGKVTAGRDQLRSIAPEFAHLNDDVLFGEVWAREKELSPKLRSIVTVTAVMSSGVLDSSLKHHIAKAKENGVTQEEMAEILTQAAFYAGWPKAWAAFRYMKEIYGSPAQTGK